MQFAMTSQQHRPRIHCPWCHRPALPRISCNCCWKWILNSSLNVCISCEMLPVASMLYCFGIIIARSQTTLMISLSVICPPPPPSYPATSQVDSQTTHTRSFEAIIDKGDCTRQSHLPIAIVVKQLTHNRPRSLPACKVFFRDDLAAILVKVLEPAEGSITAAHSVEIETTTTEMLYIRQRRDKQRFLGGRRGGKQIILLYLFAPP